MWEKGQGRKGGKRRTGDRKPKEEEDKKKKKKNFETMELEVKQVNGRNSGRILIIRTENKINRREEETANYTTFITGKSQNQLRK